MYVCMKSLSSKTIGPNTMEIDTYIWFLMEKVFISPMNKTSGAMVESLTIRKCRKMIARPTITLYSKIN